MTKFIDFSERLFLLILALSFWVGLYGFFWTKPYLIALAVSETLAVAFILIRRPGEIATKPFPLLVALLGTSLPLLARPGGVPIVPPLIFEMLLFGGVLITIWAKLSLNRSFGLVAANRGVKRGGPYRLVRHPMYAGYFLNQLGFLLSAFSWKLLALYVVAWLFQVLRIREEEKVLFQDAEYARYAVDVPRRILPGY